MTYIKQNKSDYNNKKLFNSTLYNDMKIGQNVGTLGITSADSRWALKELNATHLNTNL